MAALCPLSYAGIGVAGGTCTRHLGVGNAVFCSLNYGHMITAGGVAPPASAVWMRRSAVELRGQVLDWCARRARTPSASRPPGSRSGASALFRPERRRYAPLLLPVDDSNVALRGSEPRVLPLH